MSDSGKDSSTKAATRGGALLREIAELRELRARRMESIINIDNKLALLEREYAELVGALGQVPRALSAPTRPAYGGVRNAILDRLMDAEDGLTSSQLARALRARFGDDIHPKSHLQALKRLGQDGLASKTGEVWRLTGSGADAAVRLRTWD